jgi:hypothetical protein
MDPLGDAAFLPRSGNISRTCAVLIALPLKVQNMGLCPFNPSPFLTTNHSDSAAAACASITATRASLPLPCDTRNVQAAASKSATFSASRRGDATGSKDQVAVPAPKPGILETAYQLLFRNAVQIPLAPEE